MRASLGRHDFRVGVSLRIGTLGALGVVALLLVSGIYLLGQRSEAPLQKHVDVLTWTYHRVVEMVAGLGKARLSEAEFFRDPNEAKAQMHLLALQKAQSDLTKIAGLEGLSDTARTGARMLAQSISAYAAQSVMAIEQQRILGLNSQSGLRGRVRDSLNDIEQMLIASGEPSLIGLFEAGRWSESIEFRAVPFDRSAFETQATALRMEVAASSLDALAKTTITERLADYRRDYLAFAAARTTTLEAINGSKQAFENAHADGAVALGLVNFQGEREQAAVLVIRERTATLMRCAIAVAMIAVAVLAWRIGRSVSRPLARVAALTGRLAEGDLGVQIQYTERRDEIGDVARALAVFRDTIEANRAAGEQIYRLAHHDALTGLANRTLLHERLGEAIGRAQRGEGSIAVLCLDLDGFKAVNDLHGHTAGDQLLRKVGGRLLSNVREIDTVARTGGDEFIVVQEIQADHIAVRTLAERLTALLAEPYDLDGNGTLGVVTASIGVALYPDDGASSEELLRNADTALYRAKWAGKNHAAFFQPEMDRELRERRAMEHDLKHAVMRGEFALAWQPLAMTAGLGSVTGFEVLLRWNHPRRGLVPPDLFIPVAEASGAIGAIGSWVLREACIEAAGWSEPLQVAVNVSPIQAQQGETFAEMVEQILTETGLDPSRLMLEITEGVLIHKPDRVLTALRRLKAQGVKFALDDFGTGYSSLATLRAFPFDKLKIDRSFITGITADGQDAAIVRAVLGLARGLGLPVVAEGIETEAQLHALRDQGCEEVQGWLIGRPSPIGSFADVVETTSSGQSASDVRPRSQQAA